MNDVAARVKAYRDVLDAETEVGIHAHDVRDLLTECGKRRLVGGQEDMIVDIALTLAAEREAQPA